MEKLNLVEVESKAFKRIGYKEGLGILLQYNGGKVYNLESATTEDYKEFLESDSKGRYLAILKQKFGYPLVLNMEGYYTDDDTK